MSKATVLQILGEGLYAVRLEYDTSNLDAAVAALQQQLVDLTQPILDAEVALLDLQDERDTLAGALDAAIDAYTLEIQADPAGANVTPVIAATKALAAKGTEVDIQRLRVQRLKNKRLTLAARKTLLENNSGAQQPVEGSLVWCADYSVDIPVDTVVPLSLVPGELSGSTWTILPRQHPDGYGEIWFRDTFGQLVPRLSMTPEATFYNWCMLPGWQRWMPTFRHAIITAIDDANSTCTVTLDTARSSANPWPHTAGIPVNLAASTDTILDDVPIRYMTCDHQAFDVGDKVLVRFQGVSPDTAGAQAWANPQVVGFVTNPRECPAEPEPPEENLVEWFEIGRTKGSSTRYWRFRWDADAGEWLRSAESKVTKGAGTWVHRATNGEVTTIDPPGTRMYRSGFRVLVGLPVIAAATDTSGSLIFVYTSGGKYFVRRGGLVLSPADGIEFDTQHAWRGTFNPDGSICLLDAAHSDTAFRITISGDSFTVAAVSKTALYVEDHASTQSESGDSGTRAATAIGRHWEIKYFDTDGNENTAGLYFDIQFAGDYSIADFGTPDADLDGSETRVQKKLLMRSVSDTIIDRTRTATITYDHDSTGNRTASDAEVVGDLNIIRHYSYNPTIPGFGTYFDSNIIETIDGFERRERRSYYAGDVISWFFDGPSFPSEGGGLITKDNPSNWLNNDLACAAFPGIFPNTPPSPDGPLVGPGTAGNTIGNADGSVRITARRISASVTEWELFGTVGGVDTDLRSMIPDYETGDFLTIAGPLMQTEDI